MKRYIHSSTIQDKTYEFSGKFNYMGQTYLLNSDPITRAKSKAQAINNFKFRAAKQVNERNISLITLQGHVWNIVDNIDSVEKEAQEVRLQQEAQQHQIEEHLREYDHDFEDDDSEEDMQ